MKQSDLVRKGGKVIETRLSTTPSSCKTDRLEIQSDRLGIATVISLGMSMVCGEEVKEKRTRTT